MCIAIWKPKELKINEDTLVNCWNANPNGAGFMYAEDNKLHIIKGLMTYEAFHEAYEPHKAKACVLHFRIATHGLTNEENTHPFLVSKTLGMVHNGIINKVPCNINKDMSDSWHFIEKILKPLKGISSLWLLDSFKIIIEDYINNSKLIFLDNKGNCSIYNESLGNWHSECWFSNTSYVKYEYVPKRNHQGRFQQAQPPFTPNTPHVYTQNPSDLSNFDDNTTWMDNTPAHLKEGDYAVLHFEETALPGDFTNPDEKIPAGTKVKIMGVFGQHRIHVVNPINNLETFTAFWRLKIWEPLLSIVKKENNTLLNQSYPNYTLGQEIVFSKNYNHFRVGRTAKISCITKNFIIIKDNESLEKTYSIPKHCIRPITDLLPEGVL